MKRSSPLLSVAGIVLAFVLSAAPATAATRTWVSGKGSDANACTLAAPCRTFAFAITQTADGGEIDVLDPAGYGALNITKSISIVNDGVGEAGVQAGAGATAVTINAPADAVVHLRGLTIEGANSALNGVQFVSGASFEMLNCVVRHFTLIGIWLNPNTTSAFSIANTTVSDNGSVGIYILPQGSAGINGIISGVTANNNNNGIVRSAETTSGKVTVTVVNSLVENNNSGFVSAVGDWYQSNLVLRNVTSNGNNIGVLAYSGGTIWLSQSVVAGNSTGIQILDSSTVYTYQDNEIGANGTDISGTLTPRSYY
jgi:hypothetical protein